MKNSQVLIPFLLFCTVMVFADTSNVSWGARGAAVAKNPTVESMLQYAVEDEYLARAEYEAIMAKFGAIRPFSNIIKSEESHIGWISDVYQLRKSTVPKDRAKEFVVVPATLEDAFKTGVQAEIDNIAMYDSFLANPLIQKSENAVLQDLFTRLRDASKNHFSAFQNGLTR